MKTYHSLIGCNLSPLLFSIFINNLGLELNKTNLGLPLVNINIAAIFFADDITILGKNKASLDHLMAIERTFFKNHHLELSVKKSKVMSHDSATGKTTFDNIEDHDDFSLESVVAFKFLGITLNSSPFGFFRTHNENAKAKAKP